jgi:uncharacterized protein (DUF305 family)
MEGILMSRTPLLLIVTLVTAVSLTLAVTPANLAVAQTPTADHAQHHPATPAAGGFATDVCAGVATPAAGMRQAGMIGTPPMGSGNMPAMTGQFDLMFIDMMMPHHAAAVAMAEIARTRAEHPEVRALAEDIIASQTAEIAQMQAWRNQWFPDASAMPMEQMAGMMGEMMGEMMGGEMGKMMGEMMGEMMPGEMMPGEMMGTPGSMPAAGGRGVIQGMGQEIRDLCATTENFDRAFVDAMIPHHQSAIMMAQAALERAEHPELKSLAQAIIAAQQREIDQMQAWRGAWSGAATPTP